MAVHEDDPRLIFAIPERIRAGDEVIADWAHRRLTALGPTLGERHAVRALSPDEKTDVPALATAIRTRVGCIGAMGSRNTTLRRRDRLRELELGDGDIDTAEDMAPSKLATATGWRPPAGARRRDRKPSSSHELG